MKTLTAKDASGQLINLAHAERVVIAKHERPAVVVMAVEAYERLKVFEIGHVDSRPSWIKPSTAGSSRSSAASKPTSARVRI